MITKEELKNTKIKVTPEQSEKVQKLFFSLGVTWMSGDKIIQNTEFSFLYIDTKLNLEYGEIEMYFNNHKNKEIFYEDLFSENKEGTFMWAVEQMKQGKKAKIRDIIYSRNKTATCRNKEFLCKYKLVKEWQPYNGFSLNEIEATDWEIYEEPQKTLWDKRKHLGGTSGREWVIDDLDVKEALKEYLSSLNQLKDSYTYNKAKEIFGEELLE